MRREAWFRLWVFMVLLGSAGSGIALWRAGDHVMGGCGLATAVWHLLWCIDVRQVLRARRHRRRAIVIPRLTSTEPPSTPHASSKPLHVEGVKRG